jgi:DNA primase
MNLIDEIKSRINIIDLASEYGLQPVRNNFIFSIYKIESNCSLKLYPETNSFYCFATGHGGDVINFYADYWKIDIRTAVKELAAKAGLDLKQYNYRTDRPFKAKKTMHALKFKLLKNELEFFNERAGIIEFSFEVNRKQAELQAYQEVMLRRKESQLLVYDSLEKFCYGVDEEAFDYLLGRSRGLKPESIRNFRIFSIKNVNQTLEYLKDCFSGEDLAVSGLFNNSGAFVFSVHRLIIPYLVNGRIVYLRGRTLLNNTSVSKYISLSNFAGNLSLKRFYNIDTLKRVYPEEKLFICEGEFDTIIMEQSGFKAIGIPGVTNIPVDKIDLLKNYNIYAAFDNDEAGNKALLKLTQLLNQPVKVLKLNNHKDITELLNDWR